MRQTLFLLLSLMALAISAQAASLTLSWQAPTTNEDGSPCTDLAGAVVYWGLAPSTYDGVLDVGPVTQTVLDDLTPGATYYFAVTAYDTSGNESDFSAEISATIPAEEEPPPPDPEPPPDDQPPTVLITYPVHGQGVPRKSLVLIEVEAQDDHGIRAVELSVNGQALCVTDQAPYVCAWNVPAPPRKTYRLDAIAVDTADQWSAMDTIFVTSQ